MVERISTALSLLARLAPLAGRADAARDLARHVGADDLLIFISDLEIGVLIPARGLRRTLPGAQAWADFVAETARVGSHRGVLPHPHGGGPQSCLGRSVDAGSVLVLIGGAPDGDLVEAIASLLPMVGLALQAEQTVQTANAVTSLARNAVTQLRAQAASLEQARRAAHDELLERRRAEEALQQKASELERSNADLQQFAAIVSHDLQEPLRMVSSYLSLIERRYAAQLDDKGRDYMRYTLAGTTRMTQLIRALLGYAQVGAQERMFVMVPLEEVVREAVDNLAQRIADTGAVIGYDDLPSIKGDHVLLVQLMQNLLGNALKFAGGEAPRVRIEAEAQPAAWRISIIDNGIGIAAEDLERVFGVFQRVHGRERYEGHGIGLATCRRIVERHGGRIWAESTIGAGSRFHVLLPTADPLPGRTAPTAGSGRLAATARG